MLTTENDPLVDDDVRRIMQAVDHDHRFSIFMTTVKRMCMLYREHTAKLEAGSHPIAELLLHNDPTLLAAMVDYQRELEVLLKMISITYLYVEEESVRRHHSHSG